MSQSRQNSEPKVSIIIPFFNQEEFLAESIESVLAQTFHSWELILVDDGSTDKSAAIAGKYIDKHPKRILLLAQQNRANRGASSSRNLGIKHAKGEFITFLDSDDVFLPNALEVEIAAFGRNPDADAVCGTLKYWFSWDDQAGKTERDFLVNLGLQAEKLYQPPSLLVHNLRAGGRKPGMGCVILKSEFARKFSLFEDDFRYVGEDQIFWAKVSLQARIYIIDACLAKYRQHSSSSSAALLQSDKTSDLENALEWLENYLTESKIDNREINRALELYRKENRYKAKYRRIMNLYRRFLPYHIRYRIRDLIIRWRTPK